MHRSPTGEQVKYFSHSIRMQLLLFGWNQALSCIFPVVIFSTLAVTKIVHIPGVHRYDLVFIVTVLTQWILYRVKLETWDEIKVICLFHIIGFLLEVYKVHTGSWSYPENAITKFFGVPLYSGFMYSSIASYMCQAWRRLQLRISAWPNVLLISLVGVLIYVNFFTDHFMFDMRWILVVLLIVVFFRTKVQYTTAGVRHQMPLLVGFFLIGLFVWFAENIATFFGAWQYPNQAHAWHVVNTEKISSWSLLVIVSFILVAQLKRIKEREIHFVDWRNIP